MDTTLWVDYHCTTRTSALGGGGLPAIVSSLHWPAVMLHSLPLPLACVQVEDIVLFAISKAHSGEGLGGKFNDKLMEATCCSRVLLRPAPNAVNLWQAVGFQLATLPPAEQSKLESKNVPFCPDCKWMER